MRQNFKPNTNEFIKANEIIELFEQFIDELNKSV
jgi:hypothetical protein